MTLHGIFTIYMKEMEDHFSSMRFLIITALIVVIGVIIATVFIVAFRGGF